MELLQCMFCNSKIKKSNVRKHIKKAHADINEIEILKFLKNIENTLEIGSLSKINNSVKGNKIIKEESKIISDINYQINSIILKKINKISTYIYNELAIDYYSETVENIENEIEETSNLISRNKSSDLNYISRIHMYKDLKEKLEQAYLDLPSKADFIKNKCLSVYVTWNDIHFDKNFIKINKEKVIIHSIQIEGSLKILNELKQDYFAKEYKKEIYKLVVYNGICYENLTISKGLKEIKAIINEHIVSLEKSTTINKNIVRQRPLVYFDKTSLSSHLSNLKIKNDFLLTPTKLMNHDDNVIGLLENNNGILEECLLYIFERSNKVFVLWENYNPNRAGYLFVYEKDNFNENKDKLIEFITNHIEYKRESLFRCYEIKKTFNLKFYEYYLFKHDMMRYEYEQRLKSIIMYVPIQTNLDFS